MGCADVVEHACVTIPWCRPNVLGSILELTMEIASEGREGARVGALFTYGRPDAVVARSRPLILDPLFGHVPDATHITDSRLRGTVRELADLDGAFVVAADGTVVAACRYIDTLSTGIELPLGLGSRHVAAAAVSKELDILAIVVSETGVIRVFHRGHILAEIHDAIRLG